MKNKQIFSEATPPRHKGLFARFFALFFCLVMGMNVWGALPYFSAIAANSATKTPIDNVSAANAAGGVASVRVTKCTTDNSYITFTLKEDVKTVFNNGASSIFLCFKTDKAIQMSLCRSSNANLKVVASYDGSTVTSILSPVVMESSDKYFSFEANKTYYISTTSTSGNSFGAVRAYFKTMAENTNVTVYGWWEEELPSACADPVTVHFVAGGGAGTMEDGEACKDKEYTIPACEFTAPTGKEFDAWTSSNVTITDGKFTPETTDDVTLTATWRDLPAAPSNEEFKADATGVTACSYTGTLFNFSHTNAPATVAISSAAANDESGKTFAKGFLPSGATSSSNVYTFTAKADLEKIVVYYISTDSKFTTQNQSKSGNLMYQIDENDVVTSSNTANKSNTVAYAEVIEPAEGIANGSVVKIYSSGNRLAIFSVVAYAAEDVTKYHVTYAKGDGVVTGTVPTQADVAEGANFTVAAKGDLAREGYDFTGWNDGSADYAAGATYTMGSGDVTLTAQWAAHVASSDATLSDLQVAGETVADFAAATENYNVVLPFGTVAVPTVTATAADANAKSVVVTPAASLPGATTVVVTAEDNTTTKTYTINFTVATSIDVEMVWNKSNKRCDGTTPAANVNSSAFAQYLSFAFAGGGAEGSSLNTSNNAGGSFTLSAKDGFAFKSMSFFGKLQADVEFSIDGGAFTTLATTSTSSDKCYSVFVDEEVHEFVLRNTAANGAWIRNMQLEVIASTKVMSNIIYAETKGAVNSNPTKYIEGVGVASFVALGDVDGWHFLGWDKTSISAEATGEQTITAQWESTLSTDVTLSSLKYGEETIATAADKFVYNVTLPYGAAVPTVTAVANNANASIGNWTQATIETKQASFTVTAEAGNTQDYQVRFTWAPKLGAEIIKATITGNSTATASGLYAGSVATLNSSKKLGNNGHYVKFVLTAGETFATGDVLAFDVTVANAATKIYITNAASGDDENRLATVDHTFAEGMNYITLPEAINGLSEFYLYRVDSKFNPTINSVAVLRQMPSIIKKFTIGEAEGVIDQEAKTIAVTVPYGTDVTDLTPVVEAYANGGATVTPTTAQDFTSAKTYTVTSAYGEDAAVSYEVTVSVAEPACPTEVTISGTATYKDGDAIELTATTDGTGEVTYQWYKDGVLIEDAISATFSKTATMTDGGEYVCKVNQGTCEEVASAAYAVTVNKVKVTGITFSEVPTEIKAGESFELTATVAPANATYPEVTWRSDKNNEIPYFSVTEGNPTTVTGLVACSSAKKVYAKADDYSEKSVSLKVYYEVSFANCDAIEAMKFYSSGLTLPAAPTGGNAPFLGWYDNAEFTGSAVSNSSYKPSGNVTLYAKWTLPDAETPVFSQNIEDREYEFGTTVFDALTVAASPVTSYQWYKNNVAIDGATTATYTPTTVGTYKVVATNAPVGYNPATTTSAEAFISVAAPAEGYTQVDVTGDMTWDFSKAPVDASAAATDGIKSTEVNQLMANIANVQTDRDVFFSEALVMGNNNEYVYRSSSYKCFQGKSLKFHTTVDGFVTINARSASGSTTLKIGDKDFGSIGSTQTNYTAFVPAGDVEIAATGSQTVRVYTMTFTAVTAANEVRTGLEAGRMYTYCPAQNTTAIGNAEFFVPENFDGFYVNLIKVDELTAGYGYIMIPSAETVYALFSGDVLTEAVAASEETHGMQGYLGAGQSETLTGHNYVFVKNNHLQYANANYVTNGKAYIRLDIVSTLAGEPENPAPRRRIGFDSTVATGMEAIESVEAQKVLMDGVLYIIRAGKMYNVNGQLLK